MSAARPSASASDLIAPLPLFGDPLPAPQVRPAYAQALRERRSTPIAQFTDPGPDPALLDHLIAMAMRAPDHGKRTPWRFIVFEGEARAAAGRAIRAAFEAQNPDADPARLEMEANRLMRAPSVVVVVSAAQPDDKIPVWEQELSAGAVCMQLLLAANAHGFCAQWLTEWIAYDRAVLEAFGVTAREKVAGIVYLGTPAEPPLERARPTSADKISRWSPAQSEARDAV